MDNLMDNLMDKQPKDDRPVALVLGAAVRAGGVASPTLRRRAEHGAALWQAGRVRAVIGCGGEGAHPPSEARVIALICRDAGLPEAAVLEEARSTTTEENLRFARPIVQAMGASEVVVVTDRFHAPRARLVARRLGLRAVSDCPRGPFPPSPRRVMFWAREVLAYLGYYLTGKGR